MKYPKLTELPTTREIVDVFKGYNHNLRIGDGEFYDMTNLSSDNYPVLSPRSKRGIYKSLVKSQGMVAKDALCYVEDGYFVINERPPVYMGLSDTPKTLISMGAYVIIMPDKKYINTENYSDQGNIEETFSTYSEVSFQMCKADGTGYDNVSVQATPPSDPKNMDLWIDTSEVPNVLKQYSSTTAMWSIVATTYIRISATDIGKHFSVNDGVTISGVKDESLKDLNATMVIWAKGDNYIVVTGIIDKVITQPEPVTVERKMPEMDFVIESENRLWGCKYGLVEVNGESMMVNEIYASKLGDFKNWNCFMGISTDSYAASVGSD